MLQNNKMQNKDPFFQVSFTFAHHTVYQITQIIYVQSHKHFKKNIKQFQFPAFTFQK